MFMNVFTRAVFLLAAFAGATAFLPPLAPSSIRLRQGSGLATLERTGPLVVGSRIAFPRNVRARGVMLSLKMADGKSDKDAMDKSVASFTELVQKVTGKEDYKFGDLSKSTIDRLSTTIDAIQEGSIGAMDKVVKTSADPNYQFGDISKAAANEVVEWGKKERKAFESVTGKEYEFGDLSAYLATQVMEAAQKRLGPDYKFGDLSRAAADKLIQEARARLGPDYKFGDLSKAAAGSAIKAVQQYKFGDLSRGVAKLFQSAAETVEEGVRSAEEGMASIAAARLQLLEQEKILISEALTRASASNARESDTKLLLLQEMSYLESLASANPKADGE